MSKRSAKRPPLCFDRLEARDVPATLLTGGDQPGTAASGPSDVILDQDNSGRYLLFASKADNLVAGATGFNGQYNLFWRDLQTGVTKLVSARSGTQQAVGLAGGDPTSRTTADLSGDGQWVAFESGVNASEVTGRNVTDQPTSSPTLDVFRWSAASGTTDLVSVQANGTAAGSTANAFGSNPAISVDGRYVAFSSNVLAGNFVPAIVNDTVGTTDIFRRDMQAGSTALVTQANSPDTAVGLFADSKTTIKLRYMSDDGQRFTFFSIAYAHDVLNSNVADRLDTNDVFARDMTVAANAGGIKLVSVARDGNAIGNVQNQFALLPVISRNGNAILFQSNAFGGGNPAQELLSSGNFQDNNGPNQTDLFEQLDTFGSPRTVLVSGVNGSATAGGNGEVAIGLGVTLFYNLTADGSQAVFSTTSTNLVSNNDRNGAGSDVFVRNINTLATEVVSVDNQGSTGSSESGGAGISDDGRYVVFQSTATDLVPGVQDSNGGFDVFLRDRVAGITRVLSVTPGGTSTGNAASSSVFISPNGRQIVFQSQASDLSLPNLPGTQPNLYTPAPGVFDPGLKRLVLSGVANGVATTYAFDNQGQAQAVSQFLPFPGFNGPVRTASADVDGDGIADTIYVIGPGGGSLLRVVSGKDGSDLLPPTQTFESTFTGGLFVAAGDIDGDGKAEIVVSPDVGGGGRIQIFDVRNGQLVQRDNFFGIDDLNFRGGARVALGDVNGDGVLDVIVGAGFGGGPRIAIFDGAGLMKGAQTPPKLVPDFFAFPGPDTVTLRNGVFVSAGDIDGDGKADLIFGGGPGGGPRVFVISGAQVVAGQVDAAQNSPIANFFAFDTSQRGGVRPIAKDIDGDNKLDLVVGSGEGTPSLVKTYLGRDIAATGGQGEPAIFQQFDPFASPNLAAGVYVG